MYPKLFNLKPKLIIQGVPWELSKTKRSLLSTLSIL